MGKWIALNDSGVVDYIGYAGEEFENGNYKEALKYAEEVLRINPNNPVAVVIRELSNGYIGRADDDAFSDICDNYIEAMENIFDACGQIDSSYEFCDMWLRQLGGLAIQYIDELNELRGGQDDPYYNSMISSVVDSLCRVYYESIQLIKDPKEITTDLYEYILNIGTIAKEMTLSGLPDKLVEACNNRMYIRQRKEGEAAKVSDYWDSHKEESEEITKEAEEVLAKYDELKASISNLDEKEEAEKRTVQKEIDELKRQKSKLGLFKGKEKRVLDAQIKTKQFELTGVEQKYAERRRSLEKAEREINEKVEYYTNLMLKGR